MDVLVTGFEDSRIGIWDMDTSVLILTLNGHNGGVTGIQLNGNMVASSSYDGTVRLWNVGTGECVKVGAL